MFPVILLASSVAQPPPVVVQRPPVVLEERSTSRAAEPHVINYPIYIQPTVTVLPAQYTAPAQQYRQPMYMPCPPQYTYSAPAVAASSPFVMGSYTQGTTVPGAGISLQQERGRGLLRPPTRTDLTVTNAQSVDLRGGIRSIGGCPNGNCPILRVR